MPLPKIDLPIFELKLVSVPQPVKFRPFLVKEEKLLLMALQSSDDSDVLKAIKQVINNCLLSDLDIDSLPIFDVEYLFLNIRARSIGEKVETAFICKNIVGKKNNEEGVEEEVECGNMMAVEVDLLDIKPAVNDLPSKIYLTKEIGVQLKYPNINSFKPIEAMVLSGEDKDLYEMIHQCTEYIFDDEGVYYAKETPIEEFAQFLDGLTQEHFYKIIDFFASIPKISKEINHTCGKCKFEHTTILEGLSDFFI